MILGGGTPLKQLPFWSPLYIYHMNQPPTHSLELLLLFLHICYMDSWFNTVCEFTDIYLHCVMCFLFMSPHYGLSLFYAFSY